MAQSSSLRAGIATTLVFGVFLAMGYDQKQQTQKAQAQIQAYWQTMQDRASTDQQQEIVSWLRSSCQPAFTLAQPAEQLARQQACVSDLIEQTRAPRWEYGHIQDDLAVLGLEGA